MLVEKKTLGSQNSVQMKKSLSLEGFIEILHISLSVWLSFDQHTCIIFKITLKYNFLSIFPSVFL